jgi:hypothetical protein
MFDAQFAVSWGGIERVIDDAIGVLREIRFRTQHVGVEFAGPSSRQPID